MSIRSSLVTSNSNINFAATRRMIAKVVAAKSPDRFRIKKMRDEILSKGYVGILGHELKLLAEALRK